MIHLFKTVFNDSTGLYTNAYTSSSGCDSIVTLDLIINSILGCTSTDSVYVDIIFMVIFWLDQEFIRL